MPQITITETDRTTAGTAPYSNYAVAIAGFVDPALYNSQNFDAVADANGILTLESQDDFNKYVYDTAGSNPCDAITGAEVETDRFGQIGAQVAYYVLGLGLPVVYVVLNQTGLKVTTPAAGDIDKETAVPSDALTGNTSCWSPFKDKAEYDIRYIMTGLDPEHADSAKLKKANEAIAALAKGSDGTGTAAGRGDCIALVDLAITKKACSQYDAINNALTEVNDYGDTDLNCYSAAFAQKVELDTDPIFNYPEYPGSLYYVACKKYAIDRGYAEWFAAAGYARGTSRSPIKAAMPRMADAAVQKLEPRHQEDTETDPKFAVNVISLIRGVYYLYGNRTCHALNDPQQPDLVASDFLNVRELCCTLKKNIYETCKRLMFNPNSDVLWTNFTAAIRPTLESMKANQGIDAYSIRQLASTKKGEMRARILIKPIEAVENFHIDLELVDSVEGETEVTISE